MRLIDFFSLQVFSCIFEQKIPSLLFFNFIILIPFNNHILIIIFLVSIVHIYGANNLSEWIPRNIINRHYPSHCQIECKILFLMIITKYSALNPAQFSISHLFYHWLTVLWKINFRCIRALNITLILFGFNFGEFHFISDTPW